MLFSPVKTQKLADKLYAVSTLMVNFYLFDTGKNLIAFDTGTNARAAQKGMAELGLAPEKVSHVFLTHSDGDHAGGLPAFKNAAVYFSKLEIPMVRGSKARFLSLFYNKRLKNVTPLDDRRTIRVDSDYVQIISAPGHTPGSACYLINGKIFAAGDLLRITSKGEFVPFLSLMNMDSGENAQTLEQIKKEGLLDKAEWILSGHTGIFKRA